MWSIIQNMLVKWKLAIENEQKSERIQMYIRTVKFFIGFKK